MMMRLIVFAIFLSLCIGKISAQSAICNSLEDYDVHDLVNAYEWSTNTGYGCLGNRATDCTFYFSFCQLASHCNYQYSACENSSLSLNVTMIGALATTIFYANPEPTGFYAKFPAGPMQNVSNTTTCAPSLIIKFRCDPEAKWPLPIGNNTGNATEFVEIQSDPSQPCETILVYDFDGACHKDRTTTIKPSGGGGGLSGGAIFLIILFSALGVYFLFGIAYNGLVNHQSGAKLIPHSEFWIGLPLHAIAGCRCLLGSCGEPASSPSTAKAGPTAYDSV